MTTCTNPNCEGTHFMSFGGKVSDMFNASIGDVDHNGYVPGGLCIGAGDYLHTKVCITCGTLQGWKPLSEEQVKEILRDN